LPGIIAKDAHAGPQLAFNAQLENRMGCCERLCRAHSPGTGLVLRIRTPRVWTVRSHPRGPGPWVRRDPAAEGRSANSVPMQYWIGVRWEFVQVI